MTAKRCGVQRNPLLSRERLIASPSISIWNKSNLTFCQVCTDLKKGDAQVAATRSMFPPLTAPIDQRHSTSGRDVVGCEESPNYEAVNMNMREERYRDAVVALSQYMQDRNNPLRGPEYEKLKTDMFVAYNELRTERLMDGIASPALPVER